MEIFIAIVVLVFAGLVYLGVRNRQSKALQNRNYDPLDPGSRDYSGSSSGAAPMPERPGSPSGW